MQDSNYLDKVKEFMIQFNQPVLNSPTIPSQDRCNLRISLIQEELNELKEAIEKNDIVEVFDAFCDLQYVLTGAIHEFGLGNKIKDGFDEVHRSNMSKSCKTPSEGVETLKYYKNSNVDVFSTRNLVTGRYNIHRLSDKKVMKSVNYSPANLIQILK